MLDPHESRRGVAYHGHRMTAPKHSPEWPQIETVLLDMDGTLLDLRFDNYFWRELVPQRYAEQNGISLPEAQQLLRPRFAAWEGRLEWYCLEHWTRELRLDLAALKHEAAGLIAWLPSAAEFLERLRPLGKRVALVTNAHRTVLRLKLERTGLDAHVDVQYSSHDFGLPKEDPAFWERLQARDAFDPARTLLVDDSLPVLRAARTFGLRYLCEVRRPDTGGPVRPASEFHAVESLSDLLPDPMPARTG
jgi:putative hydrolase of the HAD superfamily